MSLLEIRDLDVWFGGVHAVDHLDLDVERGEIHSIIGPNGAGKTTVFNAVMNIVRKTGRVVLNGIDISNLRTHEIAGLGIGRAFQNVNLFKYMTVLENLLVGYHARMSSSVLDELVLSRRFSTESRKAVSKAFEIADVLELKSRLGVPAFLLPYGVQKVVEIGRALMSEPDLLLLDEPAAGLSEVEVGWLHSVILKVRDMGITPLLIEHDMKLVMGISTRITVMDFGKKIAEGTPAEIRRNPDVIRAYLGGVIS